MGEVDSEENKAIFIQNLSAAHSRESQELRNSPFDSHCCCILLVFNILDV